MVRWAHGAPPPPQAATMRSASPAALSISARLWGLPGPCRRPSAGRGLEGWWRWRRRGSRCPSRRASTRATPSPAPVWRSGGSSSRRATRRRWTGSCRRRRRTGHQRGQGRSEAGCSGTARSRRSRRTACRRGPRHPGVGTAGRLSHAHSERRGGGGPFLVLTSEVTKSEAVLLLERIGARRARPA
jgi:hypothetical protein